MILPFSHLSNYTVPRPLPIPHSTTSTTGNNSYPANNAQCTDETSKKEGQSDGKVDIKWTSQNSPWNHLVNMLLACGGLLNPRFRATDFDKTQIVGEILGQEPI